MSSLKSFLSSGGEWAVSSLLSMVGVKKEAGKRERSCGDGAAQRRRFKTG